jgi:hypothetical protein
MPKKQSKKQPSSPVSGALMARMAVFQQYQCLQQAWNLELQHDGTDWWTLFRLHYKITALEQRAPWLKKGALA